MNHAQIRAFHAVASQGSYTKAAQTLHVSQPTLSDHVKALEERYGVKLFKRQGRGVALTSLGHALLEITRRKFSLEAEAEQLLSMAKGMMSGKLRVAADGPYLVVPLLGAFCRRYPGINISMNFGNTERVLQDLLEMRADIAVLPDFNNDERMFALAYRTTKLVVIVNREHEWSRRRSIKLSELSEQRLVSREQGSVTRSQFEQALRQKRVTPASVLEIGSREGVREAVAAGLGIGVIAESELGNDDRLVPLDVKDAELNVTEYLTCLKEARPIPVVQAFFELFGNPQGPMLTEL
ncbi:LysR substrate-binding domain-containing protein [Neptuniibacter halophilus]|uniref:LysR substrate-binding domain-containing protein n=1 Tax=Neptuniibacter halophilus TaxID=651666 RepID=UPI0025741D83|nr:LysR substrate-binding domain-containing protein [Neptuniibacter halophilus]